MSHRKCFKRSFHPLTLVDEHHLDNGIQRNIDLVRAHAIRTAIRRPIISVAELFRINLIVLREQRSRW